MANVYNDVENKLLEFSETEFLSNYPNRSHEGSTITTEDDLWRHDWAEEFARLKKIWSLDKKSHDITNRATIPIYRSIEDNRRVAITTPCRLKKLLQFIFPTELVDPCEWQLELVRKNQKDYVSIRDGFCDCMYQQEARKQRSLKPVEKPFELYTQYLQITPTSSFEKIYSIRKKAKERYKIQPLQGTTNVPPSKECFPQYVETQARLIKDGDFVKIYNYDKNNSDLGNKKVKFHNKKDQKLNCVKRENSLTEKLQASAKLIAPRNSPVSKRNDLYNVMDLGKQYLNNINNYKICKEYFEFSEENSSDKNKDSEIENDSEIKEKVQDTSKEINKETEETDQISDPNMKEEKKTNFKKIVENLINLTKMAQKGSPECLDKEDLTKRSKTEETLSCADKKKKMQKRRKESPLKNVQKDESTTTINNDRPKTVNDAITQVVPTKFWRNQKIQTNKYSPDTTNHPKITNKNYDEIGFFVNQKQPSSHRMSWETIDLRRTPINSKHKQRNISPSTDRYFYNPYEKTYHKEQIKPKKREPKKLNSTTYITPRTSVETNPIYTQTTIAYPKKKKKLYPRSASAEQRNKQISMIQMKDSLTNPLKSEFIMPQARRRERYIEYTGQPFYDVHKYTKSRRQRAGDSSSSAEMFYQCDSKYFH